MISIERLSYVFAEVTDSLVADFDLVDVLNDLTRHAADVSGADSVGLLIADQHDQLHYMAASTHNARLLELFQLQNEQGPCLDAFRTGEAVVNSDLAKADDRWPLFAPRAIQSGFHSVHAFPMRVQQRVIGALNIFGAKSVTFQPSEVRLVQAIADVATIALLQDRALTYASTLTEQLQGALNSRILVEQAKGAVARLQGVDVDAAFDLLRTYSHANGRRLSDVAREVLADPSVASRLTSGL